MAGTRLLVVALLGALACFAAPAVVAQSPTLTIAGRDGTRTYTLKALLATADVRSVTSPIRSIAAR